MNRILNKTTFIFSLLLTLSLNIFATDYYVSKDDGDDSNVGSELSPLKTIQSGIDSLNPGDVLYILGSQEPYVEDHELMNIPSNTTIQAYDTNNKPIILPPTTPTISCASYILLLGGNETGVHENIIIDGLIFDGTNTDKNHYGLIRIGGNGTNYADKVTIKNCELRNARRVGILIQQHSDNNIISNVKIHDILVDSDNCGTTSNKVHGVYIASSNNTVKNCEIYNVTTDGILIYNSSNSSSSIVNNDIYNNRIYSNLRGVHVLQGENNKIYNNIIYIHPEQGIYVEGYANKSKIYNNTLYKNHFGVTLDCTIYSQTEINEVKNNIIVGNQIEGGSSTYDQGIKILNENSNYPTIIENNLIDDQWRLIEVNVVEKDDTDYPGNHLDVSPNFVNGDNYDFDLCHTSVAVDNGQDLTSSGITDDIEGTARPLGSGFDIGAYEFKDEVTIYYVAPEPLGDDDINSGTSESDPFETIEHALTKLIPGDKLLIMSGTYNVSIIDNIPSGRGECMPITIAALVNHNPEIKITSVQNNVFNFNGYNGETQSHIVLDGLKINGNQLANDVINIGSLANHITIKNCEITDGILDGVNINSSNNEIKNCEIHTNSRSGIRVSGGENSKIFNNIIRDHQSDQGVYITGNSEKIDVLNNTFYLNHLSVLISNTTTGYHEIKNNIIEGNQTSGGPATYNAALNGLCGIKTLVTNGFSGIYNVYGNAFNPSQQDIIDGNCEK